jgi:hypothetical protein
MLRPGFGERDWVIPNERIKTGRSARKGPSRSGFAVKAASRSQPASAIATAIVTQPAAHDLRLFRRKRAPCIIDQRFLQYSG